MSDLFDELRHAVHDLLHGNATPEERRSTLVVMRDSMVRAKIGLDELRQGIVATQKRLELERGELTTVRRRKELAAAIPDAETVRVAERFEGVLLEKVSLFERKLETQEAELALGEREYAEMSVQYAAAQQGGPLTSTPDPGSPGATRTEMPLDERSALRHDIDRMARERRRAEADANAEEQLAALKRRMGR